MGLFPVHIIITQFITRTFEGIQFHCSSQSAFWNQVNKTKKIHMPHAKRIYWSIVLQESAPHCSSSFLLTVANDSTRNFPYFYSVSMLIYVLGYSYELSRQLEPPVDLCSPNPWRQRTLTKKFSSWVSSLGLFWMLEACMLLVCTPTCLEKTAENTDVTVGTISIYPLLMTVLWKQLWLEALCFWVDYFFQSFLVNKMLYSRIYEVKFFKQMYHKDKININIIIFCKYFCGHTIFFLWTQLFWTKVINVCLQFSVSERWI